MNQKLSGTAASDVAGVSSSESYFNSIHRLGRITVLLAMVAFCFAPLGICLYYGISVPIGKILSNTLPVISTFIAPGICEFVSYAPIMGAGALYVSCVTGNLGNMKIPAALNALAITGYESGSEEGDVACLIAICVSSIVTVFILILGMVFLAPIVTPILSHPFVEPAINNLVPALQGAMIAPFIIKGKKQAIEPILLPLIILLVLGRGFYGANQGYIMILLILISVGNSYLLYKREHK